MKLKTIRDVDIDDKCVILRVAFDLPIDTAKELLTAERISDDSRIRDVLPTIKHLVEKNCRVVVAAGWLGRPKGADPDLSMAPAVIRLQELMEEDNCLRHPVLMAPNALDGSSPRSVNKNRAEVKQITSQLKPGQLCVLENVRYDPEANADDQDFARFIADLGGHGAVYVNEAEAQNHRPEATIVSTPRYVVSNGGQAVFGLRYPEIVRHMGSLSHGLEDENRGSFVLFLSGKKIETDPGITSKISVTNALMDKMRAGDTLVVGGAVVYTFLVAQEFLGRIKGNLDSAGSIIDLYNKTLAGEVKAIKEDGKPDASRRASDREAQVQKSKSDKLLAILGITPGDIRGLIGDSYMRWGQEGEQTVFAARVILKANDKGIQLMLAEDHVIADKAPDKGGYLPKGCRAVVHGRAAGIPAGWLGIAPGPRSVASICSRVRDAGIVLLAGPLSIEDPRAEGLSHVHEMVLQAIGEAKGSGGTTIAGGGDTTAVINRFGSRGSFTAVSNAGGATLELIEKGTLPGIEAITVAGSLRKGGLRKGSI
ncbi:MAG: phosphoglycerate kinase [archaeon]